jgi:hypothetical protein
MKKIKSVLIAFFTIALTFSQATEERSVGNFTKIKASSSVDVEYTQVPTGQSISVTWDADLMKYLKTETKNNVLKIYIDNEDNYFKSFNTKNLKIVVTNPGIGSVEVSSSATLNIKGNLNVTNFDASVSSSATLLGTLTSNNINLSTSSSATSRLNVTTDNVNVTCSSSSDAILKGTSKKLNLKCSSSADCKASELTVTDANITASSSADVFVNVSGTLNATASSSASIKYLGEPKKVNAEKSSSGSVSQK